MAFTVGEPVMAPVLTESSIKHREKRATVESVLDWPFNDDEARHSRHAPSDNIEETTALTDGPGAIQKKSKWTIQRAPKTNHNNNKENEVRILQTSQINAAYTSLASDQPNMSSEYTSMSSSFVQRVAKRKESIDALHSMSKSHQRTSSEPIRKMRPVAMESVADEEDPQVEYE
jgi:hypothetical protein